MTKIIIPDEEQQKLKQLVGTELSAYLLQLRSNKNVPASYRVVSTYEHFYDASGMLQADIDAYELLNVDTAADVYYKDKDIIAMCATIEEVVNVGWETLTNAQRRSAVVARAVRFNQHRKWVERNYTLMSFPT